MARVEYRGAALFRCMVHRLVGPLRLPEVVLGPCALSQPLLGDHYLLRVVRAMEPRATIPPRSPKCFLLGMARGASDMLPTLQQQRAVNVLGHRRWAIDVGRNVKFRGDLGLEDHHCRISGLALGPHLRFDGRHVAGKCPALEGRCWSPCSGVWGFEGSGAEFCTALPLSSD